MDAENLNLAGVIATVVFGIATLVLTVIVFRREKRRVSVDFSVLSDIKLIRSTGGESFTHQIEVSYNGRTLAHPRIVDVKIKNTGNTPVRGPDAYVEPIVIELQDDYRPIEAAVIAKRSELLSTGEIFEKMPNGARRIAIRPSLLNQGDWFILRMLFDNTENKVIGSHRIEGAPPMRRYDEGELSGYRSVVNVMFAAIALFTITCGVGVGLWTRDIYAALLSTGAAAFIACIVAGIVGWQFLPQEAKGPYPPGTDG